MQISPYSKENDMVIDYDRCSISLNLHRTQGLKRKLDDINEKELKWKKGGAHPLFNDFRKTFVIIDHCIFQIILPMNKIRLRRL